MSRFKPAPYDKDYDEWKSEKWQKECRAVQDLRHTVVGSFIYSAFYGCRMYKSSGTEYGRKMRKTFEPFRVFSAKQHQKTDARKDCRIRTRRSLRKKAVRSREKDKQTEHLQGTCIFRILKASRHIKGSGDKKDTDQVSAEPVSVTDRWNLGYIPAFNAKILSDKVNDDPRFIYHQGCKDHRPGKKGAFHRVSAYHENAYAHRDIFPCPYVPVYFTQIRYILSSGKCVGNADTERKQDRPYLMGKDILFKTR